MKKIFDFGKKKQFPPCPPFKLPIIFGVQTSNYIPGYLIQIKDLPKIHKAALLGDVAKVQLLLLLGKNNVNEVDEEKRTCLHLACANGHPDVVSLLIERKCELNLLDRDSRTPFMKAIQCEKEECATILLQHGADPNLGDGKNNALHYVAFYMDVDLAAKLLHYKADIEAKNKEGLTPLFFAIRGHNYDMAEFLLKNGANVNALDGSKRTTLMVAVSMQYTEMVNLLLEYNVDHTIEDPFGRTAEAFAKIYNYPLYVYVNQMERHMERNKPCTPQISCSEKATVVPGSVSKASSLNKKVAEKSSTEESISRLSEKPRPDDPCPSTKDELNFEMEKLPKLKLTKTINAAQHMTKIKHMDNIVYTKVTPFYEDKSLSDIEDLTDSFPKSSSQAQSHDPVPPAPAYFAKSSLMKSTLLDIFNEDSEDSEKEKNKSGILVDVRGKKITCETRNIASLLQAHKTSEKYVMRKALEEEEDTVSSWDSEEYPKDSEVEEKKSDVLVDNNTIKETISETPNIPNEQQAHSISEKSATRKRLEEEEDTESLWDSEDTPGTLLEVNARRTHAVKNQNIKGSISLEQHEDLKENSEYKGSSNRSKKRLDSRSLEQCTPGTVLEVDPSLTHASENQNIKGGISLEQYEDIKENSEYKGSSDRSKESFDERPLEQCTPGTVLEVDPSLTHASENQNIKGGISLEQYEDIKENSEYKGSSDRSKESFDERPLEQCTPGTVLEVDPSLTHASENQNIKGGISLEQYEDIKENSEYKGSSDRSKESFDERPLEQCTPGTVLEVDPSLTHASENQNIKGGISLEQYEDIKENSEYKGSSDRSKESFDERPLEQCTPGTVLEVDPSLTHASENQNIKGGISLEQYEDIKENSEYKGSSDRSKESFDERPLEQCTSGIVLQVDPSLTHASENQNIKGGISLEQYEDIKENSEYKGSSDRSKESFDERPLEQCTSGIVLQVDPSLTHASENQNIKGGISLEQYEDIKENSEYKGSSDRSKESFDERPLEQYTPGTVLEVDARLTNAYKNQNIKGSMSLDEHEDLKQNSEYKGSSDRSKERFDPRSLEQFAPGIVLGVDSRLTPASKNQNIKGSISLEQQKDLKQKLEFKGSSDRSKERFDARHRGQHAPGSILERVTRLICVWRNQKRKCGISLAQQEEVGKIPLNKVKTVDSSTQTGSDSDTGSKDGVILEKPVPKKPSEPPLLKEEAKQSKQEGGKSPLKEVEVAESSAQAGSGPDAGSKIVGVLEKPVPQKPSERPIEKEETKQNLKPKSEFKGSSDRSKESFDKRYLGKNAPGSVLERLIRLLRARKNQYRKGGISLGHHEEVGKSPLKEDETAESSTQGGRGSDTGSKVEGVLEKPVPKKPSEPPVEKEEAKQHKKEVEKSPLKEVETAEASAQAGSESDTVSKVGVVLEKQVSKKPSEPSVLKEEAEQKVGKSPLKEVETAEASAQAGSGSKVGVVLDKRVPKKASKSLEQNEEVKQSKKEVGKSPLKEVEAAEASAQAGKVGNSPLTEDAAAEASAQAGNVKGELKLKELSNGGQEGFSNSDQKQDKVTLETTSIPEEIAPKKQDQSLCAPFLSKERMSEGPESIRKSYRDDTGAETKSKESCKKTWIEEEKKVKNKSRIKMTELQQVCGEIYEKDRIAEQTKGNLQKNDIEEDSKEITGACPTLANNLRDFVEKEKRKGPLRVRVLKSFSGQTEQDRENAVSHNFQENILQCSQNSTLQCKNDDEPERECTCKVKKEDIAYVAKNIKRTGSKISINKMKEDKSFDIKMVVILQENTRNLEPHSGGLLQSSAPGRHFTHSGDIKSIIQEKKPEIITPRKCKEKTKHIEASFKNRHHNDSNSIDEPRCLKHSLPYKDKMSKNYLDAELNQHTQRLTTELGIMQTKSLTLEKEKISPQKQMEEERKMEILERKDGDKLIESRTSGKINKQFSMESHQNGKDEENKIPGEESPIMSISSKENLRPTPVRYVLKGHDDSILNKTDSSGLRHAKRTLNENNKDKGEMPGDTLDDITESLETDTENCNLPPSIYTKDSDYIWEKKQVLPIYEPAVEFKNSQWTRLKRKVYRLEKVIIGLQEELSERRKTKHQLKNQKAECDRKLYRSRLEGEKQSREKLQTQIHYPSCASSAVLEHESQTSKGNLEREQDKWLLLKENLIDKIDILSIQLSKVEDEIYQLHNALRMKTLLLEQTPRELKEFKDKLKQLKKEIHIQNKKLNRLVFKEESLQERLAQMQKKIELLQKSFEDFQNKAVFISKGVQVQFKDSPMTFCADTAEKDPALKKRNKESVDEICISLREKLRKFENENSKNKDTIRKLRKKLADCQKKQLTILQEILSHQTVLFLKQKLQEKVDENTHKLQKSREEDKQKLQYLKERKDYKQKLKMERATFEDAIKQQMDKTEKVPKQFLEFLIIYEEELQQQSDEVSSRNRHMESINRHLQEEAIENLKQKYDRQDLKHHLETPMDQIQYGPKIKEKVKKETEEQPKKSNPLLKIKQLKSKFRKRSIAHQELKAELERYRNQEYRFTTGPFLEPMNNEFVDTSAVLPRRRSIYFTENTVSSESSSEDCFSTKYDEDLQQQFDASRNVSSRNTDMESINRCLQEETIETLKQKYDRMVLKHHLKILNYSQGEQYGPKVKEQVKEETEVKVKKINPLLKIKQLKAKFCKRNIRHQELKAELERYRKFFSQEHRFTTGPFLEPMNNEFVDTSVVLPRRRSIYFTENTVSSESSSEDCFSTIPPSIWSLIPEYGGSQNYDLLRIQQAMENSVAKRDDDISELPSTSRWASPRGCTRRPNLNWDPVSRPTQHYSGNFKRHYEL